MKRNAADRRDDGGLYMCDESSVYVANVTFLHNFHDQKWYDYIIFIVGGYAVLFFFLGTSYAALRHWKRFNRMTSITVTAYSDIGEKDPLATDLDYLFTDPPAASLSDDEVWHTLSP